MKKYAFTRTNIPTYVWVLVCVLFSVLVCMYRTETAKAAVTLNPDPTGNIPTGLRDYLRGCDTSGSSPAFVQWISFEGVTPEMSPTITVPYGTTSLNFNWNAGGAVCYTTSAVYATRFHIMGGSSGLAWTANTTLDFRPNYRTLGNYQVGSIPVNYSLPAPLTSSQVVEISIFSSAINWFSSGLFGCVNGPSGNVGNLDNPWGCSRTTPTFYVTVNVTPPPPATPPPPPPPPVIPPLPPPMPIETPTSICQDTDVSLISSGVSRDWIVVNQQFRTQVRALNRASGDVYINDLAYRIAPMTDFFGPPPPGSRNADLTFPYRNVNMSPGESRIFKSQGGNSDVENITVSVSGLYKAVWSFNTSYGQTVCSKYFYVVDGLPPPPPPPPPPPAIPPSCAVQDNFGISTGVAFRPRVTVTNVHTSSIELVGSSSFIIRDKDGKAVANGGGAPEDGSNVIGASGGTKQIVSQVDVVLLDPGTYTITWTVPTTIGNATDECGIEQASIRTNDQPYVRFYGNDVILGGGIGDTCTPLKASANGYAVGNFATPANHQNYRGAAAELAVFASGTINSILPGSQDPGRTLLGALSFANDTAESDSMVFGGRYANPLCADDYWGSKPETATVLSTSNDAITNRRRVYLQALDSGTYSYVGDVELVSTTSAVNNIDERLLNGKRITIYVQGNVFLGDSSFTGARLRQFAYNTGPWSDMEEIPLLQIIVKGNIYVDNNVTQLDGMYVALPNDLEPNKTGEIYTCSVVDALGLYDLRTPTLNETEIGDKCGNALVVNGAVIAKKVHLLRHNGSLGSAFYGPENYDSGNIAEVFRYSPELHLALLSRSKGMLFFDSYRELPPAF